MKVCCCVDRRQCCRVVALGGRQPDAPLSGHLWHHVLRRYDVSPFSRASLQALTPLPPTISPTADVGGFFGNPETELVTRWYQAGAFYPFFRAHAHIGNCSSSPRWCHRRRRRYNCSAFAYFRFRFCADSKRREPWLFGEPHLSVIRSAIRTRYALLPYWYSVFYQHSQTGLPVLRPMWVEFPTDPKTVEMEDQFLVGRDILVKPVTTANQLQTTVYLPSGEVRTHACVP